MQVYQINALIDNRYVVQQNPSEGSFSYVYKVLDELSSQVVALKIFKDGTGVLEQLRREFQILNKLNHPHITKIYDIGQLQDGAYYLKLEYIEGITLDQMIKGKQISLSKAKQIVLELLDALKYLHSQNIIHRDIKPNNIMVNDYGAIIVDFNISREGDYASSHSGTPYYMPPEVQISGWDKSGDLYSLGVVLYEMITSEKPFKDIFSKSKPRNLLEINPFLDSSLINLIQTTIAVKPEERFHSAEEMEQAVQNTLWDLKIPIDSSLDLDLAEIPPQEFEIPNFNPYLSRLLTFYSQSRFSNVGTRGLDGFSRLTYVPTRLDLNLRPDIMQGLHSLVIITGNAGDGKTAFIQKLEEEAFKVASNIQRLSTGNGSSFIFNSKQYLTNYDGSQDEGDINNDEVLKQFFEPFRNHKPSQIFDRVHLIAINEGRLVDFLQAYRDEFPFLYQQVRDFFELDNSLEDGMIIVNLNLRSVVAEEEDGSSIFDQMLSRMAHPKFWEHCETCDIAKHCYAKFNADSINDLYYGKQIRERLKTLFEIIHFRQQLHMTIRDLRSALAFILFGTEDCNGIHSLLDKPDKRTEYLGRFYYNALFSREDKQPPRDRLIHQLEMIDPGQVSNPKLDLTLGFTPPDNLNILPLFDTRHRFDLELLSERYLSLQNAQAQQGQLDTTNDRWINYHASLRRKIFFERIEQDVWLKMLPYSEFTEFLQAMKFPDNVEHFQSIRDDIVLAISRSEGINELGKEYMCLRSSQEAKVKIKSFRRFERTKFQCTAKKITQVMSKYIEYMPSTMLFRYRFVDGLEMEINLDLYEMLNHILQGYKPSLNELRGSFINLVIFKRQLSSTNYQEILLTQNSNSFYRVQKTQDMKLIIDELTYNEERN